jgi:acyl-CoA synthetase (AMP-forming)/AMP-acid ligase II
MSLRITAPTDEKLAEEYLRQGWWRTAPLREGLEHIADTDGDRVAIIDNDGTWTYAQLRERVEAGVGTLRAMDVAPESPVVIVAPNSRDTVAAILATVRANGVAVVIDRRCGAADLANAVTSSGARHVVVPDELRSALRVDEHPVTPIALDALTRGTPDDGWAQPDPFAPRLVVFTSGTTRRSKGVIHSLVTIGAGSANLARSLAFTEQDRPFLSSPIGTITGLGQVLMSLCGGSILLEDRFDPARSLASIEQHRVSVIGGAPVIMEKLFAEYERQGRTSTCLQRIALGGATIPRTVLEVAIDRFGIKPTRAYGSSEVPVHTCTSDSDTLQQRLSDDGVPLPGSECRLGDEFTAGHELQVRGPNLFQGYLYPEDNEGAFVDGWFSTGDLVEQRGVRLRVLGRLKDVVARKGLKISLAEVDDAATKLEGVAEAAAYAVPDEETGERVALALHVDQNAPTYDDVVASLLGYGLARGKLPEEIVFWQEPLPRNASGKIVRSQLRDGAESRPRDRAPRLAGRAGAPAE